MERVILTTGGTGGHIFPALAVAEEIRRRSPGAAILFMGGEYGQEADLAVKAGLEFSGLPVRGVMGRGLRGFAAAFGMGRGVLRALRVIRAKKPEIVIGFGGYAAFAGLLAAKLAGLPTAIHEQNAFPGMTNRVLGRTADRIFLSMPDSSGSFAPARCRLCGNPVRAGIAALYEETLRERQNGAAGEKADARPPRLLVMGGSLGARAINDGLIACAGQLLDAGLDIRLQTGQADYERVRLAFREAGAERVRVDAFIDDMPGAYAWADLVFCRAGATSLAEITAAGLPALLSPFPHAARDHQRFNARWLEQEGAAVVLEQERYAENPQLLADCLSGLLHDRETLRHMACRSLAAARPYAARDMVDEIEALLAARR